MSSAAIPLPRDASPNQAVSDPAQPSRPARNQEPPPPPVRDLPLGTFPRRIAGRAPDGRRWNLFTSAAGVTVEMAAATVAEAHVWARHSQITIEFWVDATDLPEAVSAQLVELAFDHPSVHSHRPILVCLRRRDGALQQHVLRHVDDPSARTDGMTCLIEGTVRNDSPPPSIPLPRPG